jgi:hypothetical protein
VDIFEQEDGFGEEIKRKTSKKMKTKLKTRTKMGAAV